MMNIYEFQNTMEQTVKVVEAIWNGTITFSNKGEGDVVCHIGEYWFYFYNGKLFPDTLTSENLRENVGIFELAEMIINAIDDLDDDEYTYYWDILRS
ncbi:hypothetical protein [Fusicatenibacter saccharivorans]|uniref:hypothetical protein n=1 Tax=Fusicatenibacter saccharivorans TaxID=1150298 RepID=UPI0034A5A474